MKFEDLPEYGKGVRDGVVHGAFDFIDLCTHPEKIAATVRGGAAAVGNAAQYYTHTPINDVAKDASAGIHALGGWLQAFGHASAYERGRVGGTLIFAGMLGEGAGLVTRGVSIGAETTTLRSSAHEFEKFVREFAQTPDQAAEFMKAAPSWQFAQRVDGLVDALPKKAHSFFVNHGIRVVSLRELGMIIPKLENTHSLFTTTPNVPRILLSEAPNEIDGVEDARRLELSLRYELAHSVNWLTLDNKLITETPELQRYIDSDLMQMDSQWRYYFWHNYSWGGSEPLLRHEIAAQIASRSAVPNGRATDEFFARKFPLTKEALDLPKSLFRFDHH